MDSRSSNSATVTDRCCRSSVACMATSSRASSPACVSPTTWPRRRSAAGCDSCRSPTRRRTRRAAGHPRSTSATSPGPFRAIRPGSRPNGWRPACWSMSSPGRTCSSTCTVPGPRTRCRCSSAGATMAARPAPGARRPARRSRRRCCGGTSDRCRPAGPCRPRMTPGSRPSMPRRPVAAPSRRAPRRSTSTASSGCSGRST